MFEIYWDDADGLLKFEYFDNKVFAHAIAKHWNKSIFLKFQAIWHVAKEELLEKGYKEIYVIIPAEDKKLIKFEKMFGFMEEGIIDNKYLVMKCFTEDNYGN